MTTNRQLAAIMFTDIAGYTTLMGKDELKAMEVVRRNRDVQKPLVEKYNGQWLKEMGDGAMASFKTASDAIYCALDIQKELNDDQELNLRIGIHLGEIMIENGDVFGDGVNIASRLESIAEPGGIYISDVVQKSVRANVNIQTAYLGELQLKHVDYLVKTYALRSEFLPRPKQIEKKKLKGRLWAELRRRNIFRAGLSYLALGFITFNLTQWASLSPILEAIIYGLVVVGLPASLYLAWNYEHSQNGFVKVTSRKAWESHYSSIQKKPMTGNFVLGVLLLLVIAVAVYSRFSNSTAINTASGASLEKSIAVLPFDNNSEDKEKNQHICDGIMVAIRNNLSQIKELRVTPQTSVEQFRVNTAATITIGESLNVSYLLQGSVQRLNEQLRIDVALVNTKEDRVIWNNTYEDNYANLFETQSKIATIVADQLKIIVTPEEKERIKNIPTADLNAWDLNLKGDALYMKMIFTNRYDPYDSAMAYYRSALSIDPGLSNAYIGMAKTYWLVNRNAEYLKESFMDSVRFWCENSLEIDAYQSDAYALLGRYYYSTNKRKLGYEQYKKALEFDPNNSRALFDFGHALAWKEPPNFSNGFQAMHEAIKSDPQSIWRSYMDNQLAWTYMSIGNYEKARSLAKQGRSMSTSRMDSTQALRLLSHSYMITGEGQKAMDYALEWKKIDPSASRLIGEIYCIYFNRCKEGEAEFEKAVALAPDAFNLKQRLGMAKIMNGKIEEGTAILENQLRIWKQAYSLGRSDLYDIAGMHVLLGNKEEAYHYLELNNEIHGWQVGLHDYVAFDPFFDSIRNEPRFKTIMNQAHTWIDSVRHEIDQMNLDTELRTRL